ncbi:MAG: BON domain-containing protein [Candidatus Omnitrophica bacterium]|nr:BON domain-containing protein [Candidatus Omnitrophota bacterium]
MNNKFLPALAAVVVVLSGTTGAVYASETDSRIESSARESYVFKTYLKDDAVKVSSQNGIATLTGTVNQYAHKSLAQETVASLPGVKSVDNQLTLHVESPPEYSDGWMSMQIKTSLLFNRNVSGLKTQVFVEEGIVTLRGEADNSAQKALAGQYAKDIRGVTAVRNEMTIKQPADHASLGDRIDDASITAQVKTALLIHHSTSGLKTGVSTSNGIVTLSGDVDNSAGKDLATKVTADIPGVMDVINNMKVNYALSNT